MRGRDAIAVALRHPDGRILWAEERLDSGVHGTRLSRLPFVRGLVVLYETLVVGTRWLVRSASVQAADEGIERQERGGPDAHPHPDRRDRHLLPAATVRGKRDDSQRLQPLCSAPGGGSGVRVVIFLGYLAVIGQSPDIKRVFQYHGAEHKTIHALEANDQLTPEAVRKVPDRTSALRHRVPRRRDRPVDRRVRYGRQAGTARR